MSLPRYQPFSLSSDAIQDILLFCTNDLKSVMNFASTCSEFQHIITECSDRFWLVVLKKLCDDDELKQLKGLKSSTLSILNSNAPNKSKSFLNIIKTQTGFRRKHDIMNQYSQRKMMDKFRFVANLKVADPFVNRLIAPMIVDSLKYSPTSIIQCLCGNSPIAFIRISHFLPVKDVIDALFQKPNAHLELDIKNRTISSCLYDFWKDQEGKGSNDLYNFKLACAYRCKTVESVLLFLTLLYLEFPNIQNINDSVMQTGYEQEKESKGIFKNQLKYLKSCRCSNVFKTGLIVFERLLYD